MTDKLTFQSNVIREHYHQNKIKLQHTENNILKIFYAARDVLTTIYVNASLYTLKRPILRSSH